MMLGSRVLCSSAVFLSLLPPASTHCSTRILSRNISQELWDGEMVDRASHKRPLIIWTYFWHIRIRLSRRSRLYITVKSTQNAFVKHSKTKQKKNILTERPYEKLFSSKYIRASGFLESIWGMCMHINVYSNINLALCIASYQVIF